MAEVALKIFEAIDCNLNTSINSILKEYQKKHGFIGTYEILNNTTNLLGFTPLEAAILKRNVNGIHILVKYGADVNRTYKGFNAYHFAFMRGPVTVIDAVRTYATTKTVPFNVFLVACVNYIKLATFNSCVKRISESHSRDVVRHAMDNTRDENGTPLLHLAILRNRVSVIAGMLSFGINTDVRFGGLSALHHALIHSQYKIVELFIKHGIDVTCQIMCKTQIKNVLFTPLEFAIERSDPRFTRMFINAGALEEVHNEYHKYIFMCKSKEVLKVLFEKMKMSILTGNRLIAFTKHLMLLKRFDIFEILVTSDIFVNTRWIPNYDINENIGVGNSILHCATVYTDDPAFATLLCKHGAAVDAKNGYRATPLHYALMHKHYKIANVLLQFGANRHIKCAKDISPFDIIVSRELELDQNDLIIIN